MSAACSKSRRRHHDRCRYPAGAYRGRDRGRCVHPVRRKQLPFLQQRDRLACFTPSCLDTSRKAFAQHVRRDHRRRARLARRRLLLQAQRHRRLFLRRSEQRRLQSSRQAVRRGVDDGLQPVPDSSSPQGGISRFRQEEQRDGPLQRRKTCLSDDVGLRGPARDDGRACWAYTIAGNENDALVVPVGLAFAESLLGRADVRLHMDDKSHPTLAGTYLAACTVYAGLFGRSPMGLNYHAGLSPATASHLQAAAFAAARRYYGR